MKFELKPTTLRSGLMGAAVAAVFAILSSFVPLLGCVGFLIYLGVGAYSVMLGRQAGSPANEMGQDGVDGGLAGLIAGLVGGVISLILVLLRVGTSAGSTSDAAAGIAIVGGLGAVGVLCGAFIFGAVLGAVGGVVYGMIAKPAGGTMTPPGGTMTPPPAR